MKRQKKKDKIKSKKNYKEKSKFEILMEKSKGLKIRPDEDIDMANQLVMNTGKQS